MPAATAINPRKTDSKNKHVTVELVPATAEDLKEFSGWNADNTKKFQLRKGLIYWLYSTVKKQFEQTPRILTEHDDPVQLLEYLNLGMIFIAKNEFKYTAS